MSSPTPPSIPLIINNTPHHTTTTYPVYSPHTTKILRHSSTVSPVETLPTITTAQTAFQSWSQTPWSERRDYLLKVASRMEVRIEELKSCAIEEMGSMSAWEDFDTKGAVEMCREAAGRISGISGGIPSVRDKSALTYRVPYGVVLAIAPWNAPIILGLRSMIFALATGNVVIFKSSEYSPCTHYLLITCFLEAGLPPGVLSLITHAPGAGAEIIRVLIAHPFIRKINFTGSTSVGRIIAEMAGRYLKPVLLELGGKCAAILCEDADLVAAARGVAEGANTHAGQVCMGTELCTVPSSLAPEFTRILISTYKTLYSSQTLQPSAQASTIPKLEKLLAKTVEQGGKIIYGGAPHPMRPQTCCPTIVTNVESTELWDTESFGPILSLVVVESVEEAVALVNGSVYGLSSSVWSRDFGRALGIAKRIEAGATYINGNTIYDEATLPNGGVKDSGFGRFGAAWGFDEFLTTKCVTFKL